MQQGSMKAGSRAAYHLWPTPIIPGMQQGSMKAAYFAVKLLAIRVMGWVELIIKFAELLLESFRDAGQLDKLL